MGGNSLIDSRMGPCEMNPEPKVEKSSVAHQCRRRLMRRLLPYLFLLYIIAYLDRVNVGFAALQMRADLKFDDQVIGFGAGIFCVARSIFPFGDSRLHHRGKMERATLDCAHHGFLGHRRRTNGLCANEDTVLLVAVSARRG